ncbi:MAG: S8 family serine peptidase [Deltaproteobacteria bacterium]
MRIVKVGASFGFVLWAITARATNPAWPNPKATHADLALPENWPDDPDYGYVVLQPCPAGPLKGQPEWRPQAGRWDLWSFYPPDTVDPCGDPKSVGWKLSQTLEPSERQAMQGTGLSADVAWTRSPGDPRVVIASHDSGIYWSEPDLVNKWYLNAGELPLPKRADGSDCPSYDCNGDGVFNVLDYTSGRAHDQPLISMVVDPRIRSFPCQGNPACHGDVNGNGLLDPQDLIAIFSDGVDDDHNGYVDDICGWDFLFDDNDPFDDEAFGHGTGQAKDSAAEGNNGIGGLGTCPGCLLLPVRVADSFVGESDHFAAGVLYSLSRGASVIQEALGTLDNTPLMQAAIDAAYARGAVFVGSAADETSLHHNYPANWEHTVVAHAVMYDQGPEDASSFIRYNNCTNAGGHLDLSTPNTGCSSEATGLSAGEAGLILSAMLAFHPGDAPLTPAEVAQLLWMNVEDIDVPGSAENPQLFPSGPGWDTYFGYGRNDAGAAVEAVKDGRIPPEIDVLSPRWFETVDPVAGPKLSIAGRVAASRAQRYDYTVSVAAGLDPSPSAFQIAATVDGASAPTDGTLATFDVASLVNDVSASVDPNAFAATVLVQAVAHYGGDVGDVPGQFRKSFFVHHDPDLFSGFPLWLGVSGESSPHLVDLDGSGKDAIVMATSDGMVHAIRYDGTELAGWPVHVDPLLVTAAHPGDQSAPIEAAARQAIAATVAVGSLAGDGKLDVVAATWDGAVFAWDASGNVLPGFPVHTDPTHFVSGLMDRTLPDGTRDVYVLGQGFFASPTLADLGGTGELEIISPSQDGWLYVWDRHGSAWAGFPVEVRDPNGGAAPNGQGHVTQHARLMATAAVGDINGDGKPEIVLGSSEGYGTTDCRAYAVWGDGNLHAGGPFLPGWPIDPQGVTNHVLPVVAQGITYMAALADLTGAGKDIIEISGPGAPPAFYDGTGKLLGSADPNGAGAQASSTDLPDLGAVNSGAFGDLDGDGLLDFVDGTVGYNFIFGGNLGGVRTPFDHQVNAWAVQKALSQGSGFTAPPLPGFPQKAQDYQFFMNYVIADIDGDGKNEAISGSGVYLLTAFRSDGSEPNGWPKNTGGWLLATPAVGDIDGDGLIDVVVPTREGWLFAWHGHGRADQAIAWESFHHDAMNSGNYGTKLEVRRGAGGITSKPPSPNGGCGCGEGGESGAFALALGLWMITRRRFHSGRIAQR